MKKYIVIFDDTNPKSEVIQDVIGEKGFADIVIKRKKIERYYSETIKALFPGCEWHTVRSIFEFQELQRFTDSFLAEDVRILHCFSNFMISDREKVTRTYAKLEFVEETYQMISSNALCGLMFSSAANYHSYLKQVAKAGNSLSPAKEIREQMKIEGLIDIGVVSNFIQCITGNFDSRYFNSLKGNQYTLVKSSSDKKKIKSEYTFYHLLPEDMKYWFVMPFNYQESETGASYTMERLHMTDLAIKWVHGSINASEFEELMDKYCYFFACRHKKSVEPSTYHKLSDDLYVTKILERIEKLKTLPEFTPIAQMMEAGCPIKTIDGVVEKYLELKKRVEATVSFDYVSVIGHGDPCFANTMYNKATKTLKFIDPKGSLTEEGLWTNPYYDVAKLSHSICGRYDFFNNALFDIKVNSDFQYELQIDFDNTSHVEIFRKKIEEHGFHYRLVRLYEASLFISMLPLHIDYPHKVFGFILNAIQILKEIEDDL